jgi:hypothetical protein
MTSIFRLAAILVGPPSRTKAGEWEWGKPHFKVYFFMISMLRLAAILGPRGQNTTLVYRRAMLDGFGLDSRTVQPLADSYTACAILFLTF